jgi:serine protease AprX
VAPGSDIVSSLARRSYLAELLPEHVVDKDYLRLSGTSTSAAVVSGVVALMLEDDPLLTPDQVKFRLLEGADPLVGSTAPGVDAFDAVFSDSQGEANQGLTYNELIDPETGNILKDSILWHSILWHSILWHSILWHSVVLD